MPSKHGIEIAKSPIARHIDLARQCLFGRTAVVDDATFALVLLKNFFCDDRTYGRGYAQEVMTSPVPPSAVGSTAIGQGVVFTEQADAGFARTPAGAKGGGDFFKGELDVEAVFF